MATVEWVVKVLAGVLVLLVRGLLLWVLVPLVSIAWLLGSRLARLRGYRVKLAQALGWADL